MQFVMQSFAVPPNSLTFSSSERVLSVRPDVTNDAVGLEDDEQVVLTLVSSLDPALIQLQPNLANVTISDDDSRFLLMFCCSSYVCCMSVV